MSTMIRGQYASLLAPGIRKQFVHWTDTYQREMEYPHLANVIATDRAYETDFEYAGLPPMTQKQEGEEIVFVDAIQGNAKKFVMYTWAMGVRASFELYEDDQYKLIMQVPKAIPRSATFQKELQFANLYNSGFTNTVTTTDGLSWFNNAHPLLGGPGVTNWIAPNGTLNNVISSAGTYPNRPATDVDLSVSAIQLMINQYERLMDSQGLPISLKPRMIVIPPELKWIAREILGTPNVPYSSDNTINSLLGEDLTYFIAHYLTSQSAWFAQCAQGTHFINFFNRKELFYDSFDDETTMSVATIGVMRFGVGVTSWMGTWGSNGP